MQGWTSALGNPARMTALDLACGLPLGTTGRRPPRPLQNVSLDDALVRLFERSFGSGPCYIPFSGGRDSSVLLAAATRHARRHRHPDPVPMTLRSPSLASAEQRRLQERVIAHLQLDDWARVECDEDLDLIGPVAARALRATGPLWPPNAHMMLPLLEAARDGVFLLATGMGDFFAFWRWAALLAVLAGRRRPTTRDAAALGALLLPAPLRARAARRRGYPPPMPWLRPHAERRAMTAFTGRQASIPLRFDRAVSTQSTHRCNEAAALTFAALAATAGTVIDQPLSRPEVAAAIAGAGGWRGFGDHRLMVRLLCDDSIASELLAPRRRPDVAGALFGQRSRLFAAGWNGSGLDPSLVDPEALRRTWLSDRPDPRTACLLQHAWLQSTHEQRGSMDETQPEGIHQGKQTYEPPTIQTLGGLAELTLGGSKWNSISDLQSGQVSQGPGS